ncbi:hypothetical protein DY000_02007648 [Brassica cretica]|uniref:Uncharacterized protein n=1 Tax=Brassica cretica TaxID=69181 RepID=A0ABQ7C469_BRACR|nr:hypothetical protein DY000_02007648 [Brassica cretica]
MTRGLRWDRALESSAFLALDSSMIERRSSLKSWMRSVVCDFHLSLFLKSFDPTSSFGRLLEYSCESWTCLSSSSSEDGLGRGRMTWTRRRLRGCSSSTCASPSSTELDPEVFRLRVELIVKIDDSGPEVGSSTRVLDLSGLGFLQ